MSSSPHQIEVDNKLYCSAREVAVKMNEFFIDKVRKLRNKFQSQHLDLRGCRQAMQSKNCKSSLNFVSVHKVEKMLRNLKSSRATAIDGLDSYSLKISAGFVAIPIHHLITVSIMQQKFPSLWKLAKILPLHKKGNILERKNCRPVHYRIGS